MILGLKTCLTALILHIVKGQETVGAHDTLAANQHTTHTHSHTHTHTHTGARTRVNYHLRCATVIILCTHAKPS